MPPPGTTPAPTRRNHGSGGRDERKPPPGNSRGGPLPTDRHPAENPGEKFTSNDTPRARQKPADALHVWAHGYLIVGILR
jgi:hypothetical protein